MNIVRDTVALYITSAINRVLNSTYELLMIYTLNKFNQHEADLNNDQAHTNNILGAIECAQDKEMMKSCRDLGELYTFTFH
jgi:hypothetical protein